ncbi:MAG TPA: NAD(P)H-hydrate epimerase [Candidatus Omnitrophota bacterium]|nr:NAD(P)H-hydrate epimerase [Candidatus Omnitrophota bacterium]
MKQNSVTVKQIQRLDRLAIESYGVPSLILMENAGRALAQEVSKTLKNKRRVCVICGIGNNAGDGFVGARHLINAGKKVDIILIGKGSKLKEDAFVNYSILKKLKYPIQEVSQARSFVVRKIKAADIIVDAIFGVGLNREVAEPFKSFIEAINTHARKIIAVDIPSGLDGTSGKKYGVCIRANKTVTFTFMKKGFLVNEGPKHAGKIIVVDIGIPKRLRDRLK